MAEDRDIVRGVSWNEVFGFTHVFKTFKMAWQLGKILLALAAIVLTYALGRVMDPIWSVASDCAVVREGEAWLYWRAPNRAAFLAEQEKWLETDRVEALRSQMTAAGFEDEKARTMIREEGFGDAADALKEKLEENYENRKKEIEKAWVDRVEAIDKGNYSEAEREKEKARAEEAKKAALQGALHAHVGRRRDVKGWEGEGIFAGLLNWEMHCIRNALGSVRRGNFAGGVSALYQERGRVTPEAYRGRAVSNVPPATAATNDPEGLGLLAWLVLMAWGLWWLFSIHWLYAIFFLLGGLAIWSVLGGGICRMAALHAAREEKIGVRTAVKYGLSKFFSFFGAPLLPLGFIVILGLCMALAGLVGSIAYLGEWLYVLTFVLCLLAGAISAFLLVGLVAGWPLMWPTIAVEDSDCFDSISRSVSYVWQRPFRYGLYSVVAVVYGTICYLFVRLFAFVTLRSVHCWSGWGMGPADRPAYALGADKLDVMWPEPTFEAFHGPMQWEAMNGSEAVASVFVALFVWLVVGVVLAFLVSFFFSAATNIYFLLRREVDAADVDDVYVEEEEIIEDEAVGEPAAEAPEAGATEEGGQEAPPAEEGGAEGGAEGGEEPPPS